MGIIHTYRAFWEAAVLSGLSGCQDEAKVHRWSATETADAEHLVFPDLSLLISLSLPAFTHARSTWLSASSADLISLSLSLSLSGVVMVTTFWYYRPSVLEEELEFDTEIPSQCPLPKPGARMHAGRMFLQKNPQTCCIFTFSLCSIFPLLTFSLFCCLAAFTPLRYRVRSGASWLAC